jgi:hypothetical protein
LVAVQDPLPNPTGPAGQRVLASVNRRVDILEWERSHDRISDAAYFAGRVAQAVLERANRGVGSSTWRQGSRVDAELAKELAIIHSLENGRKVEDHLKHLQTTLGTVDAAIVRQILGDNLKYGDVRLPGRSKVVSGYETYIARRFRDALEFLGEEDTATGPSRSSIRVVEFASNDWLTMTDDPALP